MARVKNSPMSRWAGRLGWSRGAPGMVSLYERSPRGEETVCPEKPISRQMAIHFLSRESTAALARGRLIFLTRIVS